MYPVTSNDKDAEAWCSASGGRMPQPGETHAGTGRGSHAVRYSLPNEVTQVSLIARGEGRNARLAQQIVPDRHTGRSDLGRARSAVRVRVRLDGPAR
ncbi:hypothetical protein GCM10029964_092690 [Kibdelosporangium lantanae]